MMSGWWCALFLALVAAVSGVDEHKIVGSEVHFKPDNTAGPLDSSSIVWKYRTNLEDVIKVIEWDNEYQSMQSRNPKFKDRVELNKTTGELTIRDLNVVHTGFYTIEINNKGPAKEFKLTVMAAVPKPELKEEATNNPDVVYLLCEYVEEIRWKCTDKEKSVGTSQNKNRTGESYTFKKTKNPDNCCTCTLTNPVSNKTSDPVCEKDVFPESGNIGAVVVACVIGILFILIVVFLVLYLCNKTFHEHVHQKYKDTPCVGGILGPLENCRNNKEPQPDNAKKDSTDAEKGNSSEELPLKENSENGGASKSNTCQTAEDEQDKL